MSQAPGKTGAAAAKSRGLLPKVFGYDFFISFKLGAPPRGAQSYASDLARRLRELDYTVFFSEDEAAPGEELDTTLVRALRSSRILIVVVNSGALESHWVRKEVEDFRKHRPKRKVLLINVDRAIEVHGAAVKAEEWLAYEGRIWQDEMAEALTAGIVSESIVERIRLAPQFMRANRILRSTVTVIVATLAALTIFSWFKNNQSHGRLLAYNLTQGRAALLAGRALEAAPSLLRVVQEGGDNQDVRFMLARALASPDRLVAGFDASAVAFSPEGKLFAIARKDGPVEIRDAFEMKVVNTLGAAGPVARAFNFSADGTQLLMQRGGEAQDDELDANLLGCGRGAGDEARVSVWDVSTAKLLHEFPPLGFGHDCQDAFFSGDGDEVVVTSWTVQRTDLYWFATLYGKDHAPLQVTAPPDPQISRLCVWGNVHPARDSEGVDQGCMGKVVGVSEDGTLVAIAPWDMPQRRLDIFSTKDGTKQTLPLGRDVEILQVAFSLDGERVLITLYGAVEVWSRIGPTRIISLPLESGGIGARFSPDSGRVAATRGERDAVILDTESGDRLAELTGHTRKIRSLSFSSDGLRVLTGGDDGVARLWDAWSGRSLATLEGDGAPVIEVGFSADDRLMVTRALGDRINLWNNRHSSIPKTLQDDPSRVQWWTDPEFSLVGHSPDGAQALLTNHDPRGPAGNMLTLWDIHEGLLKGSWRVEEPKSLWPDKPAPPAAEAGSKCRKEPATDELLTPLAQDGQGHEVVLDVASQSRTASLQSIQSCESIRLSGHGAKMTAAAFSPSSRLVMTGDHSGEVRVWNTATGELLSIFNVKTEARQIAFLREERAIVLSQKNVAMVLDVSLDRRTADEVGKRLACSRLVPQPALAEIAAAAGSCSDMLSIAGPNPLLSAESLLTGGWARRQGARSQLLLDEAARLFASAQEPFHAVRSQLALRAVALRKADRLRADLLGQQVEELMTKMALDERQRQRLIRLGEMAFNEFADDEMAKLAFEKVLERAPEESQAQVGLWEMSLVAGKEAVLREQPYGTSVRLMALSWVAVVLNGKPTDEVAREVWNIYVGTTVDPFFERLDFRGLRRHIENAKMSIAKRRQVMDVLHELEFPGSHGDRIKLLLGVPEDTQTVGP
ncbi:MAG TPA: TIR domain-containing protein [Povalibacter sp.]